MRIFVDLYSTEMRAAIRFSVSEAKGHIDAYVKALVLTAEDYGCEKEMGDFGTAMILSNALTFYHDVAKTQLLCLNFSHSSADVEEGYLQILKLFGAGITEAKSKVRQLLFQHLVKERAGARTDKLTRAEKSVGDLVELFGEINGWVLHRVCQAILNELKRCSHLMREM